MKSIMRLLMAAVVAAGGAGLAHSQQSQSSDKSLVAIVVGVYHARHTKLLLGESAKAPRDEKLTDASSSLAKFAEKVSDSCPNVKIRKHLNSYATCIDSNGVENSNYPL